MKLVLEEDGCRHDVERLFNAQWLELQGAAVGKPLWIELPEQGLMGEMLVTVIAPCPALPPEGVPMVIGRYRHTGGRTIEVSVEGEPKPWGVTPTHMIWSVDRQNWVEAGKLRVGERLQGRDGVAMVLAVEWTWRDEPVYNIEVDGDHCYRVGKHALLVHNASMPCPTMNTPVNCSLRTVPSTTWYTKGTLEMSGGGSQLVVMTAGRTNLQTPPWWNAFVVTPPYNNSRWEKGHIIASRFSGNTGYCNFSAQHRYVNQSIFRVCENRIASALGCGCIKVTVTPFYGSDPVVPERFTIIAQGQGGNTYNLNVTFRNNPTEPVPKDCML